MPSFLAGDELGNLKRIRYVPGEPFAAENTKTLSQLNDKSKGIQKLSVGNSSGTRSVITAHADGCILLNFIEGDEKLQVLHEWKENRLKPQQKFVGLAASEKAIFSCTSNGALRMMDKTTHSAQVGSLPMRLCDWRFSPGGDTFAYGGDEVELSVWNVEQAFAPSESTEKDLSKSKKRKRENALLPGEVWRAKNVPNDFLGLRQPVHVTSLAYLSPSSVTQSHIATGTQSGDVRHYDTRAGRRPVSNWANISKIGGVKVVEKGLAEYEVFVADHGCNLVSLDLRNGSTVYGYKGLSGAVSSFAPSPSYLASTALDRYVRIHSTHPPPSEAGQQQTNKGEVLEKVFTNAIPTVVIWDQEHMETKSAPTGEQEDENGDGVWESMENIVEDSDDDETVKKIWTSR